MRSAFSGFDLLRVLLVGALVAVSVGAGVSLVVADGGMTTIDADNPLTSDSAIRDYQDDGAVSRNLSQIAMEVTIADSREQANISGPTLPGSPSDLTKTYVCMDYRESMTREVRIYLPDEYLRPRVNAELNAINGGATASVEPAEDGNYTAMTVRFTEPTRACFAFEWTRGYYFGIKDWTHSIVNQTTGITLPSLTGGGEPWQYVDASEFVDDETVPIPQDGESMTIQYDDTPLQNSSTWISVPDCNDPAEQDVCVLNRQNGTVTLLDASDPPNPVRYKAGSDASSTIEAAINDLMRAPARAMELVEGVLEGVL